jgi:hypothetical protein
MQLLPVGQQGVSACRLLAFFRCQLLIEPLLVFLDDLVLIIQI